MRVAFATLAAALGLLAASADAGVCPAGVAGCGLAKDMLLLQTRSELADMERAAVEGTSGPLYSGDKVFLKVLKTGKRLTVQNSGKVHAHWTHTGKWQKLTVERAAGNGELRSGDEVYLQGWTGHYLTVEPSQERTVHAKEARKTTWQKFRIVRRGGGGLIMPGSTVYLWTHIRTYVDALHGVVRARKSFTGSHQMFVIELAEKGSRAPACVAPASLSLCIQCLHSGQCKSGTYCDPFMKKCVANSKQGCYKPLAECRPLCHDRMDPAKCTCRDARFPASWQLPTCQAGVTAPAPAPGEWRVPGNGGRRSGGPAPVPAISQPTGGQVSQQAWAYFKLLNDLRAAGFTCSSGKRFRPNPRRMRFDCKLWKASLLHSQDMAANGFFSHTSQDGRTPWDRARAQGTSAQGQNIAAGRSSPEGTLQQNQQFDGFCRTMMNPRFHVFAMGYAPGGAYNHYWTQMFRDRGNVDTSCYPRASMVQVAGREPEPEQAHATEDGETAYGEMAYGGMAYGEMGDDNVGDGEMEDGELAIGEPWTS
uniref:SCP domain-containing protein n=1 Tax=Zooxanthella nutricula TaxID=1333877 RepID=A0A7S2K9M8_9DINO